jgi:hypothetical protein
VAGWLAQLLSVGVRLLHKCVAVCLPLSTRLFDCHLARSFEWNAGYGIR